MNFKDYTFKKPELLIRALNTKDFAEKYEQATGETIAHNLPMRTLGDAVLSLILADYYFNQPNATQDSINKGMERIESEVPLSKIAKEWGIPNQLKASQNEIKTGNHLTQRFLSESLEAVIAAIFLDAGYEKCKNIILHWLDEDGKL
jgi:ribonuclease-3